MVFLNETKDNLPWHFLKNYNGTNQHKPGMGGVTILLKEGIPYPRLSETEENSEDNEVLKVLKLV